MLIRGQPVAHTGALCMCGPLQLEQLMLHAAPYGLFWSAENPRLQLWDACRRKTEPCSLSAPLTRPLQ